MRSSSLVLICAFFLAQTLYFIEMLAESGLFDNFELLGQFRGKLTAFGQQGNTIWPFWLPSVKANYQALPTCTDTISISPTTIESVYDNPYDRKGELYHQDRQCASLSKSLGDMANAHLCAKAAHTEYQATGAC
jgi:hypothetical protein